MHTIAQIHGRPRSCGDPRTKKQVIQVKSSECGGRPFSIVVRSVVFTTQRALNTHSPPLSHATLCPPPSSLSLLPPKRTSTAECSEAAELRCSAANSLRQADSWMDGRYGTRLSLPPFSSLSLTRRHEPCHRWRRARKLGLLAFTAEECCGGDGDCGLCDCSCLRVRRREVFFSPCLIHHRNGRGAGGHEAIVF